MRGRCGALIAAAALAAVASPAAAAPAPRAALVFVPGGEVTGSALGITSPTLGGYKRPQFSIDLSQGARISTRAYTRKLPDVALVGSRVAGWDAVVRRAHAAPGDIEPGLLASTIERASGSVAYVGVQ